MFGDAGSPSVLLGDGYGHSPIRRQTAILEGLMRQEYGDPPFYCIWCEHDVVGEQDCQALEIIDDRESFDDL